MIWNCGIRKHEYSLQLIALLASLALTHCNIWHLTSPVLNVQHCKLPSYSYQLLMPLLMSLCKMRDWHGCLWNLPFLLTWAKTLGEMHAGPGPCSWATFPEKDNSGMTMYLNLGSLPKVIIQFCESVDWPCSIPWRQTCSALLDGQQLSYWKGLRGSIVRGKHHHGLQVTHHCSWRNFFFFSPPVFGII